MSRYYFIENSFNWEEGSIKVFPQLFYTNLLKKLKIRVIHLFFTSISNRLLPPVLIVTALNCTLKITGTRTC